jgi:hypothetical protein
MLKTRHHSNLRTIDFQTEAASSRHVVEEYSMRRARNHAGPSERVGAIILCCKRRLRLMIGGNPADRIMASHASHDDVAFLHVRMTDIAVAAMLLREMVHGPDSSTDGQMGRVRYRTRRLASS